MAFWGYRYEVFTFLRPYMILVLETRHFVQKSVLTAADYRTSSDVRLRWLVALRVHSVNRLLRTLKCLHDVVRYLLLMR